MYTIHFEPNTKGNPPGKLTDVEIHFTDAAGPLAGLRLLGFAVWQRGRDGGLNVTNPARQYSINGERRSFSLLRPQIGADATNDAIKDQIIDAWRARENPEPVRPAFVPTSYDTTPPVSPGIATATARVQEIIDNTRARGPEPVKIAALPGFQMIDTAREEAAERANPEPGDVTRYDTPAEALTAAKNGKVINVLDFIPRRPAPAADVLQDDHTNASETREHRRPTSTPTPATTRAGDTIRF